MCKYRPWRECCIDCKELEYCCFIFKDMVKVKNNIGHSIDHHDDPSLHLTCSIFGLLRMIFYLDSGMQNID